LTLFEDRVFLNRNKVKALLSAKKKSQKKKNNGKTTYVSKVIKFDELWCGAPAQTTKPLE